MSEAQHPPKPEPLAAPDFIIEALFDHGERRSFPGYFESVLAAQPERAGAEREASAMETLMAVAKYLGIDADHEQSQPGYDPKGPASKTIIAAIERHCTPAPQAQLAEGAVLTELIAAIDAQDDLRFSHPAVRALLDAGHVIDVGLRLDKAWSTARAFIATPQVPSEPAPIVAQGVGAAVPVPAGWRAVTETTPPLNERVQFWCGGGWCYGIRASEHKWLDFSDTNYGDEPASCYSVEAWQPMPTTPTGEAKGAA